MSQQSTKAFSDQARKQLLFIEEELKYIATENWKDKALAPHLDSILQRIAGSARELVGLATVLRVELQMGPQAPRAGSAVPQTAEGSDQPAGQSQTELVRYPLSFFVEYTLRFGLLNPSQYHLLRHLVLAGLLPSSLSNLEAQLTDVQNTPLPPSSSPHP